MGFANLLRIADLLCQKVENKLCHVRRPIVRKPRWQIWVSFLFEVCGGGTAGICHTGLWGSPKLSSSGLAISMTNPGVQNL
jgi:hypothetical protein